MDENFLIINEFCEEPYLVSYYIAGILPLCFFIFFVSIFFPVKSIKKFNVSQLDLLHFKKKTNNENLDFKDFNNIALFRSRVISLIFALVGIGLIYTQIFKYYPAVIVYSNTTALAFDPFIYYTLIFLICSFILLGNLIYRFKITIKKEEIIYIAFFMFSSLIILFQFNLIGMFICLELFSISSYLLVTGSGRKVAIEGAIKYSLTGLLGTVFFLLGIVFCIINFNSVNLHLLEIYIRYAILDGFNITYLALCGSFFLIALFLKLGVAPFHLWILDVYKGTSPVTFIWLVTLSKVILIFVLITILEHLLYQFSYFYEYIFISLSLLSIVVGSIGGVRQSNMKGLFAYSSIVTLGYILLPFVFYSELSSLAITLSISALVVYVFNLFSFFFFLSKFRDSSILFNNLFELNNITKPNRMIAFGFIITFFSFMGLPPLLGFYPKIILLKSLFETGYYITVAICIFCTLFTSFYYFMFIKCLTLSKNKTYIAYTDLTIIDLIIIGVIIAVNCIILLYFDNLLNLIYTLF